MFRICEVLHERSRVNPKTAKRRDGHEEDQALKGQHRNFYNMIDIHDIQVRDTIGSGARVAPASGSVSIGRIRRLNSGAK